MAGRAEGPPRDWQAQGSTGARRRDNFCHRSFFFLSATSKSKHEKTTIELRILIKKSGSNCRHSSPSMRRHPPVTAQATRLCEGPPLLLWSRWLQNSLPWLRRRFRRLRAGRTRLPRPTNIDFHPFQARQSSFPAVSRGLGGGARRCGNCCDR